MTVRLNLSPQHHRIMLELLTERLPQGSTFWVFGSRATGRARRYSDLDLAIDAGRRLTPDEAATLREAFEECDLPYQVDIVDWYAIDERFRGRIAAERAALAA
jgi:predicted nucleotidyltransferase